MCDICMCANISPKQIHSKDVVMNIENKKQNVPPNHSKMVQCTLQIYLYIQEIFIE